MSRINIQGIVDDIKDHNAYAPLLEAIVNSIQAIEKIDKSDGLITVKFIRDGQQSLDQDELPEIRSVVVEDNGQGFIKTNRDSFDTFRSGQKRRIGGKGFGRFFYLKIFGSVHIESIYELEGDFLCRKFEFGREFDIIVKETNDPIEVSERNTKVHLNNIQEGFHFDKKLTTIARKLLEKLLIFFVDDDFKCPEIILQDDIGSQSVSLNEMLASKKEIEQVHSDNFDLEAFGTKETFDYKIFKVYYSKQKSRISLVAQKREVTDTTLKTYIPEFEDDFYDENGEAKTKRNYVIKSYVLGSYLTEHVSLQRDNFDFPKTKASKLYPFSVKDIEQNVAVLTREFFEGDYKIRAEKKRERILKHVSNNAPWHKLYINDVDFSGFSFNASEEEIEVDLQKYKFQKELETKKAVAEILANDSNDYDELLRETMSKITLMGQSDLAHYISSRKVILEILNKLRKRKDDGSAEYEADIHNLIYPMGGNSTDTPFENHNLWLLDERLVFSHYIASDKKISTKKAPTEPDLIVFNERLAFREGDNTFSNPLTIYEFKRPKRTNYAAKDDPINQVTNYLDEIRAGKYETPEGVEKVKVNDSTPVYAYIVADRCDKIDLFARRAGLTLSADAEGHFGYLPGFSLYIEILSFKKLAEDAEMRNKIFFKKLHLE